MHIIWVFLAPQTIIGYKGQLIKLKTPILSIDVHLLQEDSCQISLWFDLNNGALGFFEEVAPTR